MTISASMVKELREKTGVGMMECKKALEENQGDLEKAILWLRERGLSRAAKKADRVASEGVVKVLVSEDQRSGVVIELNAETDFASKNAEFIKFADDLAKLALQNKVGDLDALNSLKMGSDTVDNNLKGLIAKIGENMRVRRVALLTTNKGTVAGYTHMGGKIGSLILLNGAEGPEVQELGKDLAMHAAAAAPRYLKSDEVSPEEIETEKDLGRKALLEQGKPENMHEKILQGQINKFFKEICLTEQAFIKDPSTTVSKLVAEKGKGATLSSFHLFKLGEGIDKKKENFADEVAAALRS
ncbi:MAG: translation elongation factor Ts [Pseudobdellovibrionaceae bacterium]|uniref:translation elongation factor Ts n=1 Tax=Oligoflexus sp. TaxID=1971216 RepID=UPI0027CBB82E|nr:translation elongation factor Ts [Oligoflexus sp.]MDQ3235820.1 translation elongation factor Ts [Pseudobdellovibrionaceae bacterium]HYX32085.1 translation elongation factor Ts [Oligoflexus sp.]